MIKVVLDTNVVVSAFLSPAGKPATVLQLVLRGDLKSCYNTAMLVEYEQVLCRSRFSGKVSRPVIQRFFELLKDFGDNVVTAPSLINLPDETDRKFYDVSVAAGAALITGNKKHYPDKSFIQSPAEFLLYHGDD